MGSDSTDIPDLTRLRGVVAPEILKAVEVASRMLREAGIPHALAGGLAVGAHGYCGAIEKVDFLVGDEAFVIHAGGLITLKVPVIAVGNVRVDLISLKESAGEGGQLRPAVDSPQMRNQIPIVPLPALVHMKLKAGRQRDTADLVELLKRGQTDIQAIDRYLQKHASELSHKWDRTKEMAALEE